MLHLVGSYDMPNQTYVMFGMLLCLAATQELPGIFYPFR